MPKIKAKEKCKYLVLVPFDVSPRLSHYNNSGQDEYSFLIYDSLEDAKLEAGHWADPLIVKVVDGEIKLRS